MSNINGKAYGMTAITPVPKLQTWKVRLFLEGLSVIKPLETDLAQLSFIHFARWIIIPADGFPQVSDFQPRERLEYDYVLFMSNFNGTWDQYIDAFGAVLGHGLAGIWGTSINYPVHGTITPIKAYIDNVQFATDYYFSAYPGATATDTQNARIVQDAFDEISSLAEHLTPEQFQETYLQFVLKVQAHLGQTGPTELCFN